MQFCAYNVRGNCLREVNEESMEISFSELKQKEVVNLTDGRRLGRTCDIVFTYPEGRVCGIVVPGTKNHRFFRRNELFIDLKNITKIGEDVVLVNLRPIVKAECKPDKKHRCAGYAEPEYEPGPPPSSGHDRRSYDEYE